MLLIITLILEFNLKHSFVFEIGKNEAMSLTLHY